MGWGKTHVAFFGWGGGGGGAARPRHASDLCMYVCMYVCIIPRWLRRQRVGGFVHVRPPTAGRARAAPWPAAGPRRPMLRCAASRFASASGLPGDSACPHAHGTPRASARAHALARGPSPRLLARPVPGAASVTQQRRSETGLRRAGDQNYLLSLPCGGFLGPAAGFNTGVPASRPRSSPPRYTTARARPEVLRQCERGGEGRRREGRTDGGGKRTEGGRKRGSERERERERDAVTRARSETSMHRRYRAFHKSAVGALRRRRSRSMRSEASRRDEVNAQRSQPTRRGQCAAKPANEARSMRSEASQRGEVNAQQKPANETCMCQPTRLS